MTTQNFTIGAVKGASGRMGSRGTRRTSSTIATMRVTLGLLLCMAGTSGWAADQRPFSFEDLEFGVSSEPMPKIKEYTTDGIGTKTEYDWQGERSNGLGGTVLLMSGRGHSDGGWEFGLGVTASTFNITPSSYVVDGNTYNNGSSHSLYYRTVGVEVLGGYEYGLVNSPDFNGFLELTPVVAFGPAWVENQEFVNGVYQTKRGSGYFFDVGLRLGAFITEQRWLYGVTVSLTDRASQVKMSFPGYASTLELDRFGFGAGVVAGYRF